MKVSVVRGGGFTGLITRAVVDSNGLPAQDRDALRRRVEGVRSELAAGETSAPSPYADEAGVRLEIEDEHGGQTITASQAHLSPAQRELVNWVATSPHRKEYVVPPGRQ